MTKELAGCEALSYEAKPTLAIRTCQVSNDTVALPVPFGLANEVSLYNAEALVTALLLED